MREHAGGRFATRPGERTTTAVIAAAAVAVVMASSCGGGGGGGGGPHDGGADRSPGDAPAGGDDGGDTPTARTWIFEAAANRDVDMLFVIDNSVGSVTLQNKLVTNFPVFMQVLQGLPGGLPNLHIAVVSSSMGAGAYEVPTCPAGGDRGVFQTQPRGACADSGLMAGQHFISNVDGRPNYTGAIEDVFSCIAALGSSGCAFEQPLAAAARAPGRRRGRRAPRKPGLPAPQRHPVDRDRHRRG